MKMAEKKYYLSNNSPLRKTCVSGENNGGLGSFEISTNLKAVENVLAFCHDGFLGGFPV